MRDRFDNDWGYIILGRDTVSVFRAIDTGINFNNVMDARIALFDAMIRYVERGDSVFPQGDEPRRKNDIYQLQVRPENRHPGFLWLSSDDSAIAAREIIREIMYSFEDADGNYIKDFQSTGFNARLWELYLYAYLHEEQFDLPKTHPSPDYTCKKFDEVVFIEAVTVNPSGITEEVPPKNQEEILEKVKNYIPIKFGGALTAKLKKRYWEKPHVREHPLIFAIHDYHEGIGSSFLWSRTGLETYLHGFVDKSYTDENGELIIQSQQIHEHVNGDKVIPSGFFFLPEAENISAVLYSNSATIGKFNRMGKLAGFGSPNIRMIREGECYDHDPNAAFPIRFIADVDADDYDEYWSEGITMYHNPNALYPVNPELFPNIAHIFLMDDGTVESKVPDFYPYWSTNNVIVFGGKKPSSAASE